MAACRAQSGRSYCIRGHEERTNKEVLEAICKQLDQRQPEHAPHVKLVKRMNNRPGHDYRHAIDTSRIKKELGWHPRHNLEAGLAATITWYIENQSWCAKVSEQAYYDGRRLGLN